MNIHEYYKYSMLSVLGYVGWQDGAVGIGADIRIAIANANAAKRIPGVSEGATDTTINTLGEKIFLQDGWQVTDFHPNEDTRFPDDNHGFKASLFTNSTTNEKVLSVAGTELDVEGQAYQDLIKADLQEIGDYGMAISQVVSLFNYVQCLQAPKGSTDVIQLELQKNIIIPPSGAYVTVGLTPPFYLSVVAKQNGTGLGLLDPADDVTITGHSLGGHLAAIGQRLFPDLFDSTITYNAPGFDPLVGMTSFPGNGVGLVSLGEQLTDEFVDILFKPHLNTPPLNDFGNISVMVSENSASGSDPSGVSSFFTGTQPGPQQQITTEQNSHMIEPLMDSLALQALMEKLNPNIDLDVAGALIGAASSEPGKQEEVLLDALSTLLLGSPRPKLADDPNDVTDGTGLIWINRGDFEKRTKIHERIIELEAAIAGRNLTLASLVDINSTDLHTTALANNDTGLAYRYALVALNPFVITGDATIYDQFNEQGELDLSGDPSGLGQLSDQCLEDRARFLYQLTHPTASSFNDNHIYFSDHESGRKAETDDYRHDITVTGVSDYIFGTKNGDSLSSNWSNIGSHDHLYGMAGNDTLEGGLGNDYLEGGKGDDILSGGSGDDTFGFQGSDSGVDSIDGGAGDADTILGSAGNDTIKVTDLAKDRSIEVIDGQGGDYNILSSRDGIDLIETSLKNIQKLELTFGNLTLKEFYDSSVKTISSISTSSLIRGTGEGNALYFGDTELIGIRQIEGLGGDDIIAGAAQSENTILGGAGDDILYGGAKVDTLDGGDDNDTLYGGGEADTLDGGFGADTLEGGDDADFLYGGDGEYADTLHGGAGDDILEGGDGDDLLHGGAGSDILNGGQGNDTLTGDGGNDQLYGGVGYDLYRSDNGDTIYDKDGSGRVSFGGTSLSDGIKKIRTRDEEGRAIEWDDFYSGDGGVKYFWSGKDLEVEQAGSKITIEGFKNGNLSIYLDTEKNEEDKTKDPTDNYNPNNSSRRIPTDPLVLDLNGDGQINTVGVDQSTAYFDLDQDGFAEKTGWLAPEDGILAIDRNNNNYIDDISEVFGNDSTDGFTELDLTVNENGDRLINAEDSQFSRLKIWRDLNQDGVTQQGEMTTLAAEGISEISLDSEEVALDSNGNLIMAEGHYVRNGEICRISEIAFINDQTQTKYNPSHAADRGVAESLDPQSMSLPWQRGYGHVADLHVAYSRDETLKNLAQTLVDEGIQSTVQNFDRLLSQWSGLQAVHEQAGVDRNGKLSYMDKIWILESFSGVSEWKDEIAGHISADGGHGSTLVGNRLINKVYVDSKFDYLHNFFAGNFVLQSVLGATSSGSYYSLNSDKFIVQDLAQLRSVIIDYFNNSQDAQAAVYLLRILKQKDPDFGLDYTAIKAGLNGTQTARVVSTALSGDYSEIQALRTPYSGSDDNSFIFGSDKNDRLFGRGGDDLLSGGQGDDYLYGGSGNDTFLFGRGDGRDYIYDADATAGNIDTLKLGEGIAATDLLVFRDLKNLYIRILDSDDELTLRDWYRGSAYQLERIELADGTVWSAAELQARVEVLNPTEVRDVLVGTENGDSIDGLAGDDSIYGMGASDQLRGGLDDDDLHGGGSDDMLQGGAGNDEIYGDSGDDILEGGLGRDRLHGGSGNDSYLFGRGAGSDIIFNFDLTAGRNDVLILEAGISPEQVVLNRRENDLYVTLDSGDQARVQSFFRGDAEAGYALDAIRFADGTSWDRSSIKLQVQTATAGADNLYAYSTGETLVGLAGADHLTGDSGSDVLDGGSGYDTLTGQQGSDRYLFGRGDGQDRIHNYDRSSGRFDVLRFKDGIDPEDVVLQRVGHDLRAGVREAEDQVVVVGFFLADAAGGYALDAIEFSDATSWDLEAIKLQVQEGTAGDDRLYSYSSGDCLTGLAGADLLQGAAGSDLLEGGAGNDHLSGSSGNDTLDGGPGDDYLLGGEGSDQYLFGLGDGRDTISNYDSDAGRVDSLCFKQGIVATDIELRRDDQNLLVSIRGTDDQVTVRNYFHADADGAYALNAIKFYDGTSWDIAFVKQVVQRGTDGNDSLYGYAVDDSLAAGPGADRLFGGAGNDSLDGGAGNDNLSGGAGSDRYLFGRGDGQDQISDLDLSVGRFDVLLFKPGVLPADVQLRRENEDLFVAIVGTEDRVQVTSFFKADGDYGYALDALEFNDGTSWDREVIKQQVQQGTTAADKLYAYASGGLLTGLQGEDQLVGAAGNDQLEGGAGDDSLIGNLGDDVLDGGPGDDHLQGGSGSDRYRFGYDDGQDIINNSDTSVGRYDVLELKPGVAVEDVSIVRDADDLLVSLAGTDDSVRVKGFLHADGEGGKALDALTFSDGSLWDRSRIKAELLKGTSGADHLSGFGGDDLMTGQDGDDVLYGLGGNDTLDGGEDDDTLYGGDDNDSLLGGAGEDLLYGDNGDDTLTGGPGDDDLRGWYGNDSLSGGAGNDKLDGGYGEDVLHGGSGADHLNGGDNSDIYLFNRGDGWDVITDYNWRYGHRDEDKLVFGAGIIRDDLKFAVSPYYNHLHVALKDPANPDTPFADLTDKLTLENWFQKSRRIEFFEFSATGELLPVQGILTAMSGHGDDVLKSLLEGGSLDGGAGNDTLYGNAGDDFLEGGAGDDLLKAADGDDTLSGGAGNDILQGGRGDDCYLFGYGAGQDTVEERYGFSDRIKFADGITPQDLLVRTSAGSVNIALKVGGRNFDELEDRLTIENFYHGTGRVELYEFSDGRILTPQEILDLMYSAGDDLVVYGTDTPQVVDAREGDDQVTTGAGDDQLKGAAGNDYLNGGRGNDSYLFGRGDGQDLVEDLGDSYRWQSSTFQDRIQLTGDLTPDDILIAWGGRLSGYYRDGVFVGSEPIAGADYRDHGNDLVIAIKESGKALTDLADRILVKNWFNRQTKIETIHFANGSSLDAQAIMDAVFSEHGDIVDLTAADQSQIINSSAGDDQLVASLRDDVIDAGAGNDLVEGKRGSDVIDGGDGDDVIHGDGEPDYRYGSSGDRDFLSGGAGDDTLHGSGGDDLLSGDTGNDTLLGGGDNDTYLFSRGDGTDTIIDKASYQLGENRTDQFGHVEWATLEKDLNAGNDTLRFGEGISVADLVFYWDHAKDVSGNPVVRDRNLAGDDLIVALKDPDNPTASIAELTDKIVLKDWYYRTASASSAAPERISGGEEVSIAIIAGDYLQTAIGRDGSLGGRTVDDHGRSNGVGFNHDSSGSGDFSWNSMRQDPNNGWELFSLKSDQTGVQTNNNRSADKSISTLSLKDLSALSQFDNHVRWSGVYAGQFTLETEYFFNLGDEHIGMTTTVTALSDLTNVSFLRSLDAAPDMRYESEFSLDGRGFDADSDGNYNGPDDLPASDWVYAEGQRSGNIVGIYSQSEIAHNSGVVAGWETDPEVFLQGPTEYTSGSFWGGNSNTLGMAFSLGDLALGESVSFDYAYLLNDPQKLLAGDDTTACGEPEQQYVRRIENLVFADGTVLSGHDLNDALSSEGDDRIAAVSGESSVLSGLDGDDVLNGDSGDDLLFGDQGNDRLDGGFGNNQLDGGVGNDVYVISSEDVPTRQNLSSVDRISDSAGIDKVLFLNDVAREDIIFTWSGADLQIHFGRQLSHQVVVVGNTVETFEMSDGSTVSRQSIETSLTRAAELTGLSVEAIDVDLIASDLELKSLQYNAWNDQFVYYQGHEGDNRFSGKTENEKVVGGQGSDVLDGHSGNDILQGGAGADWLNGGNGNDTYLYRRGDNNDIILDAEQSQATACTLPPSLAPSDDSLVFLGDIERDDLQAFWATGSTDHSNADVDDLLLRVRSQTSRDERVADIAIILDYCAGLTLQRWDGTVYLPAEITGESLEDYSDKTLRQFACQIAAGSNATLPADFDSISSFLVQLEAQTAYFEVQSTVEDTVRIENFYDRAHNIENIVLKAEGTTLSNNDLMDLLATDGSEMIRGVDWRDNFINARAGDDAVIGGEQNDTLSGGRGSDLLNGLQGDDTYVFNPGDGHDTLKDGIYSFVEKVAEARSWRGRDNGLETGSRNYAVPDPQGDLGGFDRVRFGEGVGIQDVSFSVLGLTELYVGYGEQQRAAATETDWVQEAVGGVNLFASFLGAHSDITPDDMVYENDIFLPDFFSEGHSVEEFITAEGSNLNALELFDGFIDIRRYINSYWPQLLVMEAAGRDAKGYVDQILLNKWQRLNKVVIGTEGDNYINSGDGDDSISAGQGNDVLVAGFGADTVDGGAGDDTYFYHRWDGRDTIIDAGGADVLQFGAGILLSDLVAEIDGLSGSLTLGIIDEVQQLSAAGDTYTPSPSELTQKITLTNWHGEASRIETFSFADGASYSAMELYNHFFTSEQGDKIGGLAGNNSIDSRGGDDKIVLGDGDDLVSAGTGDDEILTGAGDDTIFSGEGADTIAACAGDDRITTTGDGNLIVGGGGDDSITSGRGADHFFFGLGDGSDTIFDAGGTDWLILEDGLRLADTWIVRDGDDVRVTLDDGSSALIKDWSRPENRVENIQFGDGTVQSIASILQLRTRDYDIFLPEDGHVSGVIEIGNPGEGLVLNVTDGGKAGSFTLNQDGSWYFQPEQNFNGSDQVVVTLTNSAGERAHSTLRLQVTPVNDAPTVTGQIDLGQMLEDSQLVLTADQLLTGVSDVDGDILAISGLTASCGALSGKDNGSWFFQPDTDYKGTVEFSYMVTDGVDTVPVTASLAVIPANRAPEVNGRVALGVMLEDDDIVLTSDQLLAKAGDPDGDTLAIAELTASSGSLIEKGGGAWTFSPDADFNGAVDFNYKVTDSELTASAMASLDVAPVNDAPVVDGVVPLAELAEDSSRLISRDQLLEYSSDIDGDSLGIDNLMVDCGTLAAVGDDSWKYHPDDDFNGPVNFLYSVTDGRESTPGSAALLISPVNDAPVVADVEEIVLLGGLSHQGQIEATDIDGDKLFYQVKEAPESGLFNINADGHWLYQAVDGYYGHDSVVVSIEDGNGGMAETKLEFEVNLYRGGNLTLAESSPKVIGLKGISKDDLTLTRQGDDLAIVVRDRGTISLGGYFITPEHAIDYLDTIEGPLHLDRQIIADYSIGRHKIKATVPEGLDTLVYGASSKDILHGADGNDVFFGAAGKDRLYGQTGDDTLVGGNASDTLTGEGGNDTLYGDAAPDTLYGNAGSDALIGGDGDDCLHGDSGNDWLFGDSGDDKLYGGDGDDQLTGSGGNDFIKGGSGNDIYLFNSGDGKDIVWDRQYVGNDNIPHRAGGDDTVQFGAGIGQADVSIFMLNGNLQIQYGENDVVEVRKQNDNEDKVERLALADGRFLTDADINLIIQDMAAYANSEGICLDSIADVRQNEHLKAMVVNSWHHA